MRQNDAPASSFPPIIAAPPDPRWCARLEADRENARNHLIVDRADFDPHYDPAAPIECEVCFSTMRYIAACKILCPNCGYKRDCSDP